MQTHQIKAAQAVYETFWDCFVKGDVETLASTLDDNFEYIGSTDTEVYHNKAEMMDFYRSYVDDVAGKADIRNRQIDAIPLDSLVLVNEHADLYALVDDDWVMYAKIRFSALVWQKEAGWKLIQIHNSFPDMRAQEGEILAFDKIKEENILLQDAVNRRTIELQTEKKRAEEALIALKEAQDQLIESHKQEALRVQELGEFKSRFFTNITHEFRTPLTVILGMTERWTTDGEHWTEHETINSLNLIKRNGENLLRLVNQILDLAKLESNTLKMNYIQGDILAFTRYIAESLHSLANAHNLMLRVESNQGQILMDYDPERYLQIIHNLLSNAIKFTPSGGKIVLNVTTDLGLCKKSKLGF